MCSGLQFLLLPGAWCAGKTSAVEEVWDPKAFKQLLRTRTNVMVLFSRGRNPSVLRLYKEAAAEVRGIGTMILVDCDGSVNYFTTTTLCYTLPEC